MYGIIEIDKNYLEEAEAIIEDCFRNICKRGKQDNILIFQNIKEYKNTLYDFAEMNIKIIKAELK